MLNLRFFISLAFTLILVFLLNNSWQLGATRIPPLGKFLDPFHGFWQNIEPKGFTGPKELQITGLTDKVTVVYDSLLIPHIFANNDDDLYLAQGFVTAQHRLWQMEFQTYAAGGRLSEFLGEGPEGRILDIDRSQRRLGLGYGAVHALESMQKNETVRMIAEKYTEGINQYIATLDYKTLPLEYKLLDYAPEGWTPMKCALLLKRMALTLNIGDKDMEMTNALKLFGKETLDLLYPDREPGIDPIVDNAGGWKFDPVRLDSIPLALPDELIAIKKLPNPDPNVGSNNWAVAGSKTATGSPILCGDPHLNLTLPSIWYVIHLNAPGVNVMGASLPGAPAVTIGYNDSIAWSVTNAQRDLVDWFKITYQDSNKNKYKLDGQWVDTKKVVEEIKVRGKETFYDTVIYTHWGPVTYDETYRGENELKNYAFRWISHDHSEELLALHKLNRAQNHVQYMDALNYYGSPAQNFVFASVSGDIAMRVQGKYPVRRKDEGKFVLDGSKSSNGWQAYIPNDQNIAYKNPARGFVSSANQFPADSTYPYYVTSTSYESYRNRRINNVLRESSNITVEDMAKLQGDNFNMKANECIPVLLFYLYEELPDSSRNFLEVVKTWDNFNTEDSEGASYFEAWWTELMPMIWDEMNTNAVLEWPTSYNTIKLLKENPNLSFFDIQSTPEKETAKEIVQKSLARAVRKISKWKKDHQTENVPWAEYKDSFIGHLLPPLRPLGIAVKHGGNGSIVNAHSRSNGPSWRMIVSLEKTGVKTWAVYPGGQSGNPGSYYYSNMIDRWVADKHYQMIFKSTQAETEKAALYSTSLNPVSK
ncbi:MAG TPA: penicillin acylase family protein [Cyclobacteriaceae bacterium]|nr:penicillin acylase family protein [Cyclobacteriaceae bacterium]